MRFSKVKSTESIGNWLSTKPKILSKSLSYLFTIYWKMSPYAISDPQCEDNHSPSLVCSHLLYVCDISRAVAQQSVPKTASSRYLHPLQQCSGYTFLIHTSLICALCLAGISTQNVVCFFSQVLSLKKTHDFSAICPTHHLQEQP